MTYRKFMLSLEEETLQAMREQAKLRGITLQEQLRAVVIPEWLKHRGIKK